jgi:hypothetical protein
LCPQGFARCCAERLRLSGRIRVFLPDPHPISPETVQTPNGIFGNAATLQADKFLTNVKKTGQQCEKIKNMQIDPNELLKTNNLTNRQNARSQ